MNTNSFRIAATVVAGCMLQGGPAFAAQGDLDPTFGTGGRLFVDTPGYWEEANSITQQDDKLLVGRAIVNWPIGEHFSVIRIASDGRLDTTFDRDGKTFFNLPGAVRGITYQALPLANGKIIAAGYVSNQDGLDVRHGLVRYLHDGTPDSSLVVW
jgi:uncharacterized delta-60 repeat protein